MRIINKVKKIFKNEVETIGTNPTLEELREFLTAILKKLQIVNLQVQVIIHVCK